MSARSPGAAQALREALRSAPARWSGVFAGLLYLLLVIFKPIAPFYFEPVAAFYPSEHVTLLLSPLNLLMGTALALLFALNIAAAFHVVRSARACRTRAYSGLLGPSPASLLDLPAAFPPSPFSLEPSSPWPWSRSAPIFSRWRWPP